VRKKVPDIAGLCADLGPVLTAVGILKVPCNAVRLSSERGFVLTNVLNAECAGPKPVGAARLSSTIVILGLCEMPQ